MVTLKKLSREEVNQKPFLINQIFDLYGGVPGEFYHYQYQKDRSITRYFKIKRQKVDGTRILLSPFSRSYTIEKMDNMLNKKGFTRNVESYLLNYYNGKCLEYAEYQELVQAIKEYDKSLKEEIKLEKVLGGRNANHSM